MTASSLNQDSISILSSFAGSKKVYEEGSRPDVKVLEEKAEEFKQAGGRVYQ
ncbi:hypothetical protein [Sporosarcina globispora]|uniref:hypothetical protein n=1 Tax=Sporosarcina globispora TaxID=1459 RepID=UPI000B334092|nr:hypothetical protein [Sporosarcina globispora]